MANHIIKIIPSIYVLEVTTHTNRKIIKSFCLPCLSSSKTNREYTDYQQFPTISGIRICSKCGNMTLPAFITAYDITIADLIKIVEMKGFVLDFKNDDVIVPQIDTLYLSIIKGQLNGKANSRHWTKSRR